MTTEFNGMVREYGPVVFTTAWRILGQTADAEDVLQEVFLEAHTLRRKQDVRQWAGLLRRMATYRALDSLRKRTAVCSLDGEKVVEPSHGPEETAVGRELEDRLRAAVATLPERESAVFCLRYFEDLSYEDIAESLQISSSAVSTALNKARTKLQELLKESE